MGIQLPSGLGSFLAGRHLLVHATTAAAGAYTWPRARRTCARWSQGPIAAAHAPPHTRIPRPTWLPRAVWPLWSLLAHDAACKSVKGTRNVNCCQLVRRVAADYTELAVRASASRQHQEGCTLVKYGRGRLGRRRRHASRGRCAATAPARWLHG